MTYLTMAGMILIALAMAGLLGQIDGALPMLGMWLIWENMKQKNAAPAQS